MDKAIGLIALFKPLRNWSAFLKKARAGSPNEKRLPARLP